MQALVPRLKARRPRRLAAAAAVVALVGALACGCAEAPAQTRSAPDKYGARIDTNTPAGLRALQTMDMLNSDWPIGADGVGSLAEPDQVRAISKTMDDLWWNRPFTLSGADIGDDIAKLHVVTSFGAHQEIELRTNGQDSLVTEFSASTKTPDIKKWSDIDAVLSTTGAKYSYAVSKVNDGRCERVAGTNTAESLPLASIFKLYVLYAVSDAIKAGKLGWDEQLTVTDDAKAVGTTDLDELPTGAQISVRTAANEMISASDNMATDLLIERVGAHAVERALVEAGHHDPASMTPFPTMHELFSVGWGTPDLREQWRQASHEARTQLLQQTNSRPYQPDPTRVTSPGSAYGAEWYGSAEDICRVHAGLQTGAVGPAAPVKDVMSIVPGVSLDPAVWPYIGAKAGNLPGDLTFSWYAIDRSGQAWVLSFQLNWPRFQGPFAAGWIHSIASQAFALTQRR